MPLDSTDQKGSGARSLVGPFMSRRNKPWFWPPLILFLGDFLVLAAAFYLGRIAYAMYYQLPVMDILRHWWGRPVELNYLLFPLTAGIALLWFFIRGHYSRRKAFWDEQGEILQAIFFFWLLNSAIEFSGKVPMSRLWLFGSWLLVLLFLPVIRRALHLFIGRFRRWQRDYVLLGCGQTAAEAVRAFASEPTMAYRLCAVLVPGDAALGTCIIPEDVPRIPLGEDPLSTISELGNPHVVVALEMAEWQHHERLVWTLGLRYPDVTVAPPFRGLALFGLETNHFFSHEIFMLRSRDNLGRRGPRIVKRVFDLLAAGILLILLSPLFTVIAWHIRKEDGGPVFFIQERLGRHGAAFPCIKFRSMVLDAEDRLRDYLAQNPSIKAEYERNYKLREDPRVTQIGQLLRRTSMDELPQLLNVLRGEMSLVGPRPLLERERARYGDGIILYGKVHPGITGLWQTSGRSETTFEERAALDAWYIKNWSIWYDLVILLRTVKVVLGKGGAY